MFDKSQMSREVRAKIWDTQYEDEYDDTYDSIDAAVGTDVPSDETGDAKASPAVPKEPSNDEKVQIQLGHALRANPELFARVSAVRRSDARTQLRKTTGLGDEQIEGWFLMINRNVCCLDCF